MGWQGASVDLGARSLVRILSDLARTRGNGIVPRRCLQDFKGGAGGARGSDRVSPAKLLVIRRLLIDSR